MINWNDLTPAVYAIAAANRCDLGEAENKLQQNIREGRDLWIGCAELPREYRPVWASLGGQEALEASNDAFNIWRKARQEAFHALAQLWADDNFAGMIAAVETATPEKTPEA